MLQFRSKTRKILQQAVRSADYRHLTKPPGIPRGRRRPEKVKTFLPVVVTRTIPPSETGRIRGNHRGCGAAVTRSLRGQHFGRIPRTLARPATKLPKFKTTQIADRRTATYHRCIPDPTVHFVAFHCLASSSVVNLKYGNYVPQHPRS